MNNDEWKYWIKNWWNWYYSIEEEYHPSYVYGRRENDVHQGRTPHGIWDAGTPPPEPKVWFLAGHYGSEEETRTIMKEGFTKILAPAYNMGGSKEEFPSLDPDEIQEIVERDVDNVTDKLAELDGDDITADLKRKKWDFTNWFPVSHLPEENVLALDVENISMISDGWWLLLEEDELTIGDHILRLKGVAPNYRAETKYNITVRGPKGP
jgi:hypothetical protein